MVKKIMLSLALIVLLMITLILTVSGQEVHQAVFVSKDSLAVTIYDTGTTLVQDTRSFEVEAGLNEVAFVGVPPRLDRGSVAFSAQTDGTYITQQEMTQPTGFYMPDVLANNIGADVSFVLTDGTNYGGILLQADSSELKLQQTDGSIVNLDLFDIREFHLPNLPEAQPTEPTLLLVVNSREAGQQQMGIAYRLNELNWSAAYTMTIAPDNKSLGITGWIAINNYSDSAYENAKLTLVAGDSQSLQFVTTDTEFAAAATATSLPTVTPTYSQGGFAQTPSPPSSIFVFDLEQPVTLAKNAVRYIEFLAGADTAARNVFVYDASPRVFGYSGFISDPSYGLTGVKSVSNYLEFSTSEDGGLGMALPAGTLQIYQENKTGHLLLSGISVLPYTPLGETIQIYLENSSNVTGERRQTDFQALSPDAIQETFEIRLSNRGEDDIEVQVPERMSRSQAWEILGSSVAFEQPDPFGVQFAVTVPAGGETVITYTVLYTRTG